MHQKKPGPVNGQKHSAIKRTPFGMRLSLARKARGLSQFDLGIKAGLSQRTIVRYERDFLGPSIKAINKIAKALNVSTNFLLGGSTSRTNKGDVKPYLLKHFNMLQELPPKEQKKILDMIEIAAAKTKCGGR